MSSYYETQPALIVNLFVTSDKRRVHRCMRAPRRARSSAGTVAPTFDPSSNCSIAILFEATIKYRPLITNSTHRIKLTSIQIMATWGDLLHNRVWRAVMQKKRPQMEKQRMRAVPDENISNMNERKGCETTDRMNRK